MTDRSTIESVEERISAIEEKVSTLREDVSEERWYDSDMAFPVGIGICVAVISVGFGLASYFSGENKYKIQEANLVGDSNQPEKFYTIDNKIAIIEVDGVPVQEYIQIKNKEH